MRLVPVITQFIKKNNIKEPKISLVGLAFKGFPATDDIRNSPAVDVYQALEKKLVNPKFNFYDPIIKKFFSNQVSGKLDECFNDSNVVVFLTNHPALKNIDSERLSGGSRRPLLLVDCWHNLSNLDKIRDKGIKIFRIGDSSYLKS